MPSRGIKAELNDPSLIIEEGQEEYQEQVLEAEYDPDDDYYISDSFGELVNNILRSERGDLSEDVKALVDLKNGLIADGYSDREVMWRLEASYLDIVIDENNWLRSQRVVDGVAVVDCKERLENAALFHEMTGVQPPTYARYYSRDSIEGLISSAPEMAYTAAAREGGRSVDALLEKYASPLPAEEIFKDALASSSIDEETMRQWLSGEIDQYFSDANEHNLDRIRNMSIVCRTLDDGEYRFDRELVSAKLDRLYQMYQENMQTLNIRWAGLVAEEIVFLQDLTGVKREGVELKALEIDEETARKLDSHLHSDNIPEYLSELEELAASSSRLGFEISEQYKAKVAEIIFEEVKTDTSDSYIRFSDISQAIDNLVRFFSIPEVGLPGERVEKLVFDATINSSLNLEDSLGLISKLEGIGMTRSFSEQAVAELIKHRFRRYSFPEISEESLKMLEQQLGIPIETDYLRTIMGGVIVSGVSNYNEIAKADSKVSRYTEGKGLIYEEAAVKKVFKQLALNGDFTTIEIVARDTGVEADYQELEPEIQLHYKVCLDSDNPAVSIGRVLEITGIAPKFETADIFGMYGEFIRDGKIPQLATVALITRVAPDYERLRGDVQGRYNDILGTKHSSDWQGNDKWSDKVRELRLVTGIEPEFQAERMVLRCNSILASGFDSRSALVRMKEIVQVTKMPIPIDIAERLLLKTIVDEGGQNIDIVGDIEKLTGATMSFADVAKKMRGVIVKSPRSALSLLGKLQALSGPLEGDLEGESRPAGARLHEKVNDDRWFASLSRLRAIQAPSNNEAHDPWVKGLGPLLSSVEGRTISMKRDEDIEHVVSFVEMFGMRNLPTLFNVYIDCAKAERCDDIPQGTVSDIEEFGIKLRKGREDDLRWRYKDPAMVIQEIRKHAAGMTGMLLSNEIPEGIESKLGQEIFRRIIRGAGTFDRGHSIRDIISTWRDTVEADLEQNKVRSGYEEVTVEVDKMKAKNLDQREAAADEEDKERRIQSLIVSKEVDQSYRPHASAVHEAVTNLSTVYNWWVKKRGSLVDELTGQGQEIRSILSATPEQHVAMIDNAETAQEKKSLERRVKALSTEAGRQGLERQLTKIESLVGTLSTLEISEHSDNLESEMVGVMEELAKLSKASANVKTTLHELSAFHVVLSAEDARRAELGERFRHDTRPSVERINSLHELAVDYLQEHYLHAEQEPDHTGHTPFSNKLRSLLNSVWHMQPDKKGRLKISTIARKIENIKRGEIEESDEKLEVSIVPTSGVLKIFAGDIGSGCHTSQHFSIAKGQFPNITSWVYVTGRGTPNETLQGSSLGIETVGDDGVPTLAVRANNPRQSFLQTVNPEQLVMASLRVAIDTARRIQKGRIAENDGLSPEEKRQRVVVTLSASGASSTNRPDVAKVNKEKFGSTERVGLRSTPATNFNSYKIWKQDGTNACGMIWEIDENGDEYWYGEWDDDLEAEDE